MLLSVTLTLAEDHKVSTKQKPIGFSILYTSLLIRVKTDMMLKAKHLDAGFRVRCFLTRQNNVCFTYFKKLRAWHDLLTTKIFNVGIHLEVCVPISFKPLYCDASLSGLGINLRPQKYKKANSSMPVVSQSELCFMQFGMLLRFTGLKSFIWNSLCLINTQGRETNLCNFI